MTESTALHTERSLHFPLQASPIRRDNLSSEEARAVVGGVETSATQCDGLRGPARSMCYASLYGVNI
jgi:hypothetical protein